MRIFGKNRTIMKEDILKLLGGIVHPETQQNIVESGIVESVTAQNDKVVVVLCFPKARDPFAIRIKNLVEKSIADAFPAVEGNITVAMKEGTPKPPQPKRESTTGRIGKIIAVASGKGGVGKSTVTANLALTLRNMVYRVGVLDADIYGPSQHKMFDRESYLPDAVQQDGFDYIVPAQSMDIELMSIGFFINPDDALMWRGAMATNALKQLLHQTMWGGLDFLLIDMPPGTGDIHLTIISEIKLDGAVIVSTPQQVAVADVVRGVEMFRHEQVAVPVLGVIENMAWFTPKELPDNRYYIFGKGGARSYAEQAEVPFLGEIPLIQSIMEGGECGTPTVATDAEVEKYYRMVAEQMIKNM
jgi:ATP-binding protein involved in chromosome partitioning